MNKFSMLAAMWSLSEAAKSAVKSFNGFGGAAIKGDSSHGSTLSKKQKTKSNQKKIKQTGEIISPNK